jgi:putative ABC transport system permease protein
VLVLAWNEMWPFIKLELNLVENLDILLFLMVVVFVTGSLAGVYPALRVSRFQPAQILKGKVEIGDASYFTRTLLVLQFAFSVTALFFSIAFYQNAVFQKNFTLGFAHNEVLAAPVKTEAEFDKFRNALVHHPDVVSMTGSADHIFSSRINQPVTCNGIDISTDILDVGEGYRSALAFTLLEGRDFNPASANDRRQSVIITQNLAEGFAPESALEKTITINDSVKLFVIGVIQDVYTRGMWKEKVPMILRLTGKENYRHLIVRASAEKAAGVHQHMEQQWNTLFPGRPYMGYTMNQIINVAEDVNRNIVSIFTFLAVVALLLSIAGLYATVSLNIARRLKEVGIRKVFGASITQIIWTTNVQFVMILFLSSLAGCWLGNALVTVMMEQIWAYYQSANLVTFIVSTLMVLWLACIMIGSKVYQAASANPITALREE